MTCKSSRMNLLIFPKKIRSVGFSVVLQLFYTKPVGEKTSRNVGSSHVASSQSRRTEKHAVKIRIYRKSRAEPDAEKILQVHFDEEFRSSEPERGRSAGLPA